MPRLKPSRASAPSAANGPEIDVEKPTRTWSTGLAASGVVRANAQAAARTAWCDFIEAELQGRSRDDEDSEVSVNGRVTSNRVIAVKSGTSEAQSAACNTACLAVRHRASRISSRLA